MNRSAALDNIQIMCKEMALYVINTYRSPFRLFICGGGEIRSREGTTQGDPLAMPWYELNTSIMIKKLRDHCPLVKQVWLAGDSAGGGSIVQLYNWYRQLTKEGQKFGYLVNGSKSCEVWGTRKGSKEGVWRWSQHNDWRSAPSGSSHCVARIQRSVLWGEGSCMERGNRTPPWNSEEPASCGMHCFHKRLEVEVHLLHVHNRIVWRLCRPNPIQEVIEDLLLPTLFGQSEPLPNEVRRLATLSNGSRGSRHSWSEIRDTAAVCCLEANNHYARRFYYITEFHHGARRKIYGGAKEASTITLESKC